MAITQLPADPSALSRILGGFGQGVGQGLPKGIDTEKKYFDWLFNGKGGQLRCWSGISWKN